MKSQASKEVFGRVNVHEHRNIILDQRLLYDCKKDAAAGLEYSVRFAKTESIFNTTPNNTYYLI